MLGITSLDIPQCPAKINKLGTCFVAELDSNKSILVCYLLHSYVIYVLQRPVFTAELGETMAKLVTSC